jgi:integrase
MPKPKRYYPLSDRPNAKGFWEITWAEGTRSRRHSTRETERAAAELYRANWLLTIEQRPAQAAKDAELAQVMRAYREGHVLLNPLETGSWTASTLMVEHSALGKLLVTELTDLARKAYGKDRAAGKLGYIDDQGKTRGFRKSGPAAFRNDILCANSAMRWCVKNRVFGRAFTLQELQPLEVPPAPKHKTHWLTPEEANKLLDAAQALNKPNVFDPLYLFILIDLDTATRCTALEELTWDRLKLAQKPDGSWTGVADFVVPGRPETKKTRGKNSLTADVAAILAQARRCSNHDRVLGTDTTIEFRFRRFCNAVLGREEGPHILRHSWATWALSAGVNVAHVARVLHDTVATVTRVYQHALPDETAAAVEAVANLRAAKNGPRTVGGDSENEAGPGNARRGVKGA